ncbi:SMP-30/gluconolactonase/LRE family protein [Flexithrix dorotheae]|uniref:SMP-30/gluconolactonase/LRE family protein n=1 Tax=Flexithrix dorotheae TaxID=70993 RepID=UPI00037B0628|nr:SMP-30/gluconolactonase/LRE family protein [Flexithrix dorotheae]
MSPKLHFILSICLASCLFACNSSKTTEETSTQTSTETETQEEMETLSAEILIDAKAKLGEGAIWHPTENKFYWIDIEGKKLHIFDPSTGEDREIDTKARIGTVVPVKSGGVLAALENGIFKLDLSNEKFELVTNPLEEGIRFNDGKCDPKGRFWVGSMALKGTKGAATLYRLDTDGSIHHMIDSVTISNGIVWSLDQKKMYYIDTPTGKVMGYDYDNETGSISNPVVAVEIPEGMGHPDGMTIDAEGMIWIGMWDGYAVTRWNPETGELLGKIEVPAKNITSCAFGGENLETLYITTASIGTPEEVLNKYPQSGGVFAVKPGVKGIPAFFYED